ncbi:MAG: GNAT family N-acetyltransferase [Lentisphaerae bacterium]|nr:MAG: GNAT family N-acetyltransferase [Lentisphaerota bacterium]
MITEDSQEFKQRFSLRRAQPCEIPVIRELAHTIWPVAFADVIPPEQITYMLDLMYAETVIQREMAAGVVWQLLWTQSENQAVAYQAWEYLASEGIIALHKLYVLPAYQRQGLGRFLLDCVCQAGTQMKARAVRLRVNRHNEQALRAYRKWGFQMIEQDCKPIGNGFVMDDYIMQLDLCRSSSSASEE